MVAGLAAAAFGWWGTYTVAGQHAYDEMAGMIPFFALWGGLVLILAGGAVKYFRG